LHEPYAIKVARTVLRGGKPERAYLSRVVLANASLDTVFHDSYYKNLLFLINNSVYNLLIYIFTRVREATHVSYPNLLRSSHPTFGQEKLFYFCIYILFPQRDPSGSLKDPSGIKFLKTASVDTQTNIHKFNIVPFSTFLKKNEVELTNYIEQFFVGLLEGDGTITVDFVSNCKKRVRIVIALNNLESNRFMLNLIVKYVGGRVVIERNDRYVTWYATNRTELAKILAILAKYPLLSTRKQCQLDFAKDFISSNIDMSKEEFHKLRDNKYKNQRSMLDFYQQKFVIPMYFPA
jgi:hypothetical protein